MTHDDFLLRTSICWSVEPDEFFHYRTIKGRRRFVHERANFAKHYATAVSAPSRTECSGRFSYQPFEIFRLLRFNSPPPTCMTLARPCTLHAKRRINQNPVRCKPLVTNILRCTVLFWHSLSRSSS